ncbi:glucosylceramidase [Chitinophaga pendula]|nr:glucosylceramidase [Chitinophaga pendula]
MQMNNKKATSLVLLLGACLHMSAQQRTPVNEWLTRADRSALFQQQAPLTFGKQPALQNVITVDDKTSYQDIVGFGYALTQGSAMHLIRMDKAKRKNILDELFRTDANNIGISYIRLSIGASDLNETVFSYDDLPAGETDTALAKFDLGPDRKDVIPVMKEILAINPAIKVLGSPWSPPAWMKTNNDTRGGQLKPEYYPAYAKYLVKYIKEMAATGIPIDAITIQNEPLHPGNNPSLLMVAPDQATFIKEHLGPAFKKAGLSTKIIIYDHNADRPDYPISILDDPQAKKYIDGSGFHLYGGDISALSDVHDAHPDRHLYFTEQMVIERDYWDNPDTTGRTIRIAHQVKRVLIGAIRNWSRNVLLWNLAADQDNKPFTDRGGCPMCQGAITIIGNDVSRNLAYYVIAHASKLVRPGSVRIASNVTDHLSNVAFKTPDGKKVLIIANTANEAKPFTIKWGTQTLNTTLDAGAVATYAW